MKVNVFMDENGCISYASTAFRLSNTARLLTEFESLEAMYASGFPKGTYGSSQTKRWDWWEDRKQVALGLKLLKKANPPIPQYADPSIQRDFVAMQKRANEKKKEGERRGDIPRPFCPLEQVAPMPNCWGMTKVWGA